ncbi:MAG TPA: hypothetical protein VJ385_06850 [Fibrobacteria bacterium]|nr:hypothetical protein [Fibrobacteria bacterium]
METFTILLAKHLETFRELERLQMTALEGVKSQGLEGLTAMLTRQQEILAAIAREKGELRPYLDQWEAMRPEARAGMRSGRPGEILDALESVAQGIQARHQEMFGADEPVAGTGNAAGAAAQGAAAQGAGAQGAGKEAAQGPAKEPDLSQMINIYRALQ